MTIPPAANLDRLLADVTTALDQRNKMLQRGPVREKYSRDDDGGITIRLEPK